MVGIGAWFARRQKTTSDYFKGGGRVPWWAAGLSIYATMLSSITFMSIPAKAYATDWTYVWANLPILLLAPLIVHVYLPFFRELDVTSAYEYLERRFNLAVRLYGSAAFVLFQVGRQAIVLLLPSLALDTITDLNVYQCILLMGLLCVIYTAMGGIEAVIWTDVVQSLVLLGAAMLSLGIIILGCQGGPAGFWAAATSADKFHLANWTLDPRLAANAFWVILGGNLFIALVPYTSDQTVVQRYLTTKDQKKAARAIWTNALLAIPSTLFFFSIGTALWVYYRQHPGELQPALATDAVFPMFIVQTIPAGLAGVVIAGIFAAAQSTVSSSLNSVSTAVVTDFYRRFRPQATDAAALRLARGLTVAVGVVATGGALLLASADVRSLWDTYNALVGLTGSGLAALFLLGITTRRASGWGVLCGAIASAAVLWWVQKHTPLHFLLYAAIGIASCAILGYLASLLLPDRNKDLTGLTLHTRR
jgi:SSS family transporter